MARRVVGLDVGTFSVKVAHLEARTGDAEFDLLAYGEVPLSKFVQEGQDKSEQDLQLEALLELKKSGYLDGSWLASGLPSGDAQIRSLEVPFNNRKKIEAVLGGLMDSHLPFPVENLIYTWFPISEKPTGSQLLVGFSRKEAISQALAHVRKAEVDPRFLTLKAAALYDLLLSLMPKETASESLACVVDIGHKSTSICIGDKKSLQLARSVPRGGLHVTQSFSEKVGLGFNEAEKQKLAAVELTAPLREAYYPIAREIRQTILAMEAESHRKIEHIYLVGGGAKSIGLVDFLSSLLMVPVSLVSRFQQFRYVPTSDLKLSTLPKSEAGMALAYAAMAERAAKKDPRFNFRKEEFAFTGELDYMRQRGKTLAVWTCVVLFLLAFSGSVRNFVLTGQIEALREKQRQACKSITGQEKEGKDCLSDMRVTIAGTNIPRYSAADVYLELAKPQGIPPTAQIKKITKLDVSSDMKAFFTVEGFSFDAEDLLVKKLNENPCFHNVEKSESKKTPEGTSFKIAMSFNCDKTKQPSAPLAANQPEKK